MNSVNNAMCNCSLLEHNGFPFYLVVIVSSGACMCYYQIPIEERESVSEAEGFKFECTHYANQVLFSYPEYPNVKLACLRLVLMLCLLNENKTKITIRSGLMSDVDFFINNDQKYQVNLYE